MTEKRLLSKITESIVDALPMTSDATLTDDICFENEAHQGDILSELKSMYDNQLLVDVTICVQERKFRCHRSVLAAVSPYFRAMFTINLIESKTDSIIIQEVDKESVTLIIDYAYTGCIKITRHNAQNLLVAASIFQIIPVIDACARFMETQLDVSNCIGIHYFALVHNCRELRDRALEHVEKNFVQVSHGDEFLGLDYSRAAEILCSNELNVEKEEFVFDALMRWIQYNETERIKHMASLLPLVRFGLLSSRFIQENVISNKQICSNYCCQQLVNDLKNFEARPDDYSGSNKFLAVLRSGMIKPEHCILFIGGVDLKHPSINCYNPLTRETYYTADIHEENRSGFYSVECPACVVTDDNQIYMAGGNFIFREACSSDPYNTDIPYDEDSFEEYEEEETIRKSFYVYDSDHNHWLPKASMLFPKSNFSLAYVSGKIYCFGGLSINQHPSEIIECYDIAKNQWKYMGMMPTTLVDLSTVVLNSFIYVLGGRTGVGAHNTTMKYDPKTCEWTTLSGMPTPRFNFGTCIIDDEIYVIGGQVYTHINRSISRDALRSVEIYSVAQNQWRQGPELPVAMYNVGVFIVNGVLYACGTVEHHRTVYRIYRCNAVYRLDFAHSSWQQIESDLCNVRDYACVAAKIHTRKLPQVFRPEVDT